MSTNPSRQPGRALAVDSVTLVEAEEYCRRMSWVMGRRVRLPTEDEMRRAATGEAEFVDVREGGEAWLGDGGAEGATAVARVWNGRVAVDAGRSERVRVRGFRVVVEVDLARLDTAE